MLRSRRRRIRSAAFGRWSIDLGGLDLDLTTEELVDDLEWRHGRRYVDDGPRGDAARMSSS